MREVQMIQDNYDIIHNPKVKEKYPQLYDEVVEHDRFSKSFWYKLSDKAYEEYEKYTEDNSIGYIN